MISSPDMVMPVSWHVRAVLIALPLLFSFWRHGSKVRRKDVFEDAFLPRIGGVFSLELYCGILRYLLAFNLLRRSKPLVIGAMVGGKYRRVGKL